MGYSATVVADSVYQYHRLTTMVVTFPRIILAEFNTHRVPMEGNFRGWTQLRHLVENEAELPNGIYEP